MHRNLRNSLMATSSLMALMLISGWSLAEPRPLLQGQTAGHGMLETSLAQSQYLYQSDQQFSAHPNSEKSEKAEPPVALARPSDWITAPQPPAQADKPPTPGLRF